MDDANHRFHLVSPHDYGQSGMFSYFDSKIALILKSSYLIAVCPHGNCLAKLRTSITSAHLHSPFLQMHHLLASWACIEVYFYPSPPFRSNDFALVSTYIGTAAQSYGVSASEVYTLVSIANAGSFVGRLSTGYLADKFAHLPAHFTSHTDDTAVDTGLSI